MRINIFNQKALYTGYDQRKYQEIKSILSKNKIPFIDREWHTRHAQARGRGSIGENSNYAVMYKVYVHHKDFEKSSFLVDNYS